MGAPYAEVIGDPIAHSKSPAIHKYWLAALGMEGDYRATLVAPEELARYLAKRRGDADWRGCNVTFPHKQAVLALLDRIDPGATRIGAVNSISRAPEGLVGRNTDIDGVAAALAHTGLRHQRVAMIGAGGGGRAAIHYLLGHQVETLALIVRDPAKAEAFRREGEGRIEVWPMANCGQAMAGARAVINASPMGMEGAAQMPADLLSCIAIHAPGATMFDMVYNPLETPFLAAARAGGATVVDGLSMLIGQARAAFEMFFGRPAPEEDEGLRTLLRGSGEVHATGARIAS